MTIPLTDPFSNIVKWTLATVLGDIGNSSGTWLDGTDYVAQVRELSDVVDDLVYLTSAGISDPGYAFAHDSVTRDTTPYYTTMLYPPSTPTWPAGWPMRTYLFFEADHNGYRVDDFFKINGVDPGFGNIGLHDSIYEVTANWLNGTNVFAAYDCPNSNCNTGNPDDNNYCSPLHPEGELQVAMVHLPSNLAVCVSYTLANTNNSPANTLIAITNSVQLTAMGKPDDGSGIYTWSHSRGGTFSTNGIHNASTVTYYAPSGITSATPATTNDFVQVIYTYKGASVTNRATMKILRPRLLRLSDIEYVSQPSCTGTSDTQFETALEYGVYDQYGTLMSNSTCNIASYETFVNFQVGSPVLGAAGTATNGIQVGFTDVWGSTNTILAPSNHARSDGKVDDSYNRQLPAIRTAVWDSTSAAHPAFEADQRFTIQGASFSTGTVLWYCHTVMGSNITSGAELFRSGAIGIQGTLIRADN